MGRAALPGGRALGRRLRSTSLPWPTTPKPCSPGGAPNGGSFPAWALAARIVFASSPNSASCERVFALLRNLFDELQMKSLADYVQAALMLNYNQRNVG